MVRCLSLSLSPSLSLPPSLPPSLLSYTHVYTLPSSLAHSQALAPCFIRILHTSTDNIQCDELEVFLETILDQEFDTLIEDGSTTQVSRERGQEGGKRGEGGKGGREREEGRE